MKIKERCSQLDCLAPDGVCNEGHELTECRNFSATASKSDQDNVGGSKKTTHEKNNGSDAVTASNQRKDSPVSWTGRTLGLEDLTSVSSRNQPRVVGIIGPSEAGKTTILGMLYNFLHQGRTIGTFHFAGSFSIEGWQNIFGYMQWDKGLPPRFPPHTEATSGRGPGMLHLAFRSSAEDCIKDCLLTDAPGEWFKRWALNSAAEDAEGARWIARGADAFVLVIDCKALTGDERGQARSSYDRLINRLGDELKGRPLAVVWSKVDYKIDVRLEEAIKRQLDKILPGYAEFRVSVKQEAESNRPTIDEFARLFEWMLTARCPTKPIAAPSRLLSGVEADFMLAFRG